MSRVPNLWWHHEEQHHSHCFFSTEFAKSRRSSRSQPHVQPMLEPNTFTRDQEPFPPITANDLSSAMDEVREGAPESREGPAPPPPALAGGEGDKKPPVDSIDGRSQDPEASLTRANDEKALPPFPSANGAEAVLDDDHPADEQLLEEAAKDVAATSAGYVIPVTFAEESRTGFGPSVGTEEEFVDQNDSSEPEVSHNEDSVLATSKDSTVETSVHFDPSELESEKEETEESQAITVAAVSDVAPDELAATAVVESSHGSDACEDLADDTEKVVAPPAESVTPESAGDDVTAGEEAKGDFPDNVVVLSPVDGDEEEPAASENSPSVLARTSQEPDVQPPVMETEAVFLEDDTSGFEADPVDVSKQPTKDEPLIASTDGVNAVKMLESPFARATELVLETSFETEPIVNYAEAVGAEDTGAEASPSPVLPDQVKLQDGVSPVSPVVTVDTDAGTKSSLVEEDLVVEVAEVSEPHVAKETEEIVELTEASDVSHEEAVELSEPHGAEEEKEEVEASEPPYPAESSPEKSTAISSNDNGSVMDPVKEVADDVRVQSATQSVPLSPKKLDIPAVFLGVGELAAEKLSPNRDSPLSPVRKLEVPAAFAGGIDGAIHAELAPPDLGTPKRLTIPSAFGGDAARSPARIHSPSTKSPPSSLMIPFDNAAEDRIGIDLGFVPSCETTCSPSKQQVTWDVFGNVAVNSGLDSNENRPSASSVKKDPKATVAHAAPFASPDVSQSEQRDAQRAEDASASPSGSNQSKTQLLQQIQRSEKELISVGVAAMRDTRSPQGGSLDLVDDEAIATPQPVVPSDRHGTPPAAPINRSLQSDPGPIPVVPHFSVVVPVETQGSVARLEAPEDEIEADSNVERVISAGTAKPDPPVAVSADIEPPALLKTISNSSNAIDATLATPSRTTPGTPVMVDTSPQSEKTSSPAPSPANSGSVFSSCGGCVLL